MSGRNIALMAIAIAANTFGQPAAAGADPETVLMRVGAETITLADVDAFAQFQEENPRATVDVVDGRADPATFCVNRWTDILLVAAEGAQDRLDAQSGYPSHAPTLVRAEWLWRAERDRIRSGITPKQVNAYYQKHADEFAQVELHTVAVRLGGAAKARAAEIRKSMEGRVPYSALVARFAEAEDVVFGTKVVSRGELPSEMEQRLFAAKQGEILEAHERQGIALLQIANRMTAPVKSVESQIKDAIADEKLRAFASELKRSQQVWINPEFAMQ